MAYPSDLLANQLDVSGPIATSTVIVCMTANGTVMASQTTIGNALGLARPMGGRLSLVSNDPVPIADQVAKSIVYYLPYVNDLLSIFDGSQFVAYPIANLTLTLAGLSSGNLYDIIAYRNSNLTKIDLLPGWSNSGAGTSARASALTYQNGTLVNAANITTVLNSHAVTQKMGTWLGILKTTAANTTESSNTTRFLANFYNQVEYTLFTCPAYSNSGGETHFTHSSTTYTVMNAGTGARLQFVSLGNQTVSSYMGLYYTSGAGTQFGIGIDTDTGAFVSGIGVFSNTIYVDSCACAAQLGEGYHFFSMVCRSGTSAATFHVDLTPVGSTTDPRACYLVGKILI